MTTLALKDELMDAQALRAAGASQAGGADIGECLSACRSIDGTDLDSWHREWTRTAQQVLELAEAEASGGRETSARLAFFRASTYFRTAGVMLMSSPADPRLVESNRRQTDAFRRGARLLAVPPAVIEIPYEGTTLPGYFFRAHADSTLRPTVILTSGYDGTAEELYFFTGAAALERGYNVVAFDGPGQGAALLQQGLVLRPDWEHVVGPVVDFTIPQPGVDPSRIALIGLSLGANLAPRAAAHEHRLAACVADGGSFDLFESALARMPNALREGYLANRPVHTAILRRVLEILARKPTAGWALRRGQLAHGCASPIAYLEALRDYSLKQHAGSIRCPTLVCNAEGDDISATAPHLYAALVCAKEFITFKADEGAGDHCEAGARTLYHARSFAWLDQILHPAQASGVGPVGIEPTTEGL